MRTPRRQDKQQQSSVNSFGMGTGKKVASDLVGKASPLGGKLTGLAGKAQFAVADGVDFGISSTGKLLGKAGGGLGAILMDPTPIANDPMEGGYGAMLDNERFYHNSAIDRDEQMGPPVPAGDIRRIVDAEIDAGLARTEIERKKKAERDAFGVSKLIGLISSMGGGIR